MVSKKHKIDYSTIKINQFNFRDEKEFNNPFLSIFRKLAGTEWRMSPFKYKDSEKPIKLQVLGDALGFSKQFFQDMLAYHDHRLKAYRNIRASLYYVISFSLIFLLVVVAVPIELLSENNFSGLIPLLITVTFLMVIVIASIAFRLSQLFALRFYSDSISVQTILFIIVELARCKNPLTLLQRKKILGHIDLLETATRSIAYRYNLNTKSSEWATKHFQKIEFFIQEREKWVIASKQATLNDLQQDFYHLATIYITGNFGEFENEIVSESMNNNRESYVRNFLIGIPRFVIGIVLPVLGLLTISWRPEFLTNIIDIKVFALICIGWLLLAIDVMLKLGIVSSVVGVAKGIKDLA